jgi:hypothetical protein
MPMLFFISIISLIGVFLSAIPLTITGLLMRHPYPTQTLTYRLSATSKPTSTNLPVKLSTPISTATRLFITPTILPSVTSTPTPDIWSKCNASYTSRLQVGDKAYVSNNPHLSNRLRAGPYIDKKIIGYIDPGEQVEIIEGP